MHAHIELAVLDHNYHIYNTEQKYATTKKGSLAILYESDIFLIAIMFLWVIRDTTLSYLSG